MQCKIRAKATGLFCRDITRPGPSCCEIGIWKKRKKEKEGGHHRVIVEACPVEVGVIFEPGSETFPLSIEILEVSYAAVMRKTLP